MKIDEKARGSGGKEEEEEEEEKKKDVRLKKNELKTSIQPKISPETNLIISLSHPNHHCTSNPLILHTPSSTLIV